MSEAETLKPTEPEQPKRRAKGKTVEEGRKTAIPAPKQLKDFEERYRCVRVPIKGKGLAYDGQRITDYESGLAVPALPNHEALHYEVLSEDPKVTGSRNMVLMGVPHEQFNSYETARMELSANMYGAGATRIVTEPGDIAQTVSQGAPVDPDNLVAESLEAGEQAVESLV